MTAEQEQQGRKGCAIGFEGLRGFLKDRLPRNKMVGTAFRITRDALSEGASKPFDAGQGRRNAKCIPAWAWVI